MTMTTSRSSGDRQQRHQRRQRRCRRRRLKSPARVAVAFLTDRDKLRPGCARGAMRSKRGIRLTTGRCSCSLAGASELRRVTELGKCSVETSGMSPPPVGVALAPSGFLRLYVTKGCAARRGLPKCTVRLRAFFKFLQIPKCIRSIFKKHAVHISYKNIRKSARLILKSLVELWSSSFPRFPRSHSRVCLRSETHCAVHDNHGACTM